LSDSSSNRWKEIIEISTRSSRRNQEGIQRRKQYGGEKLTWKQDNLKEASCRQQLRSQ
jgi:hypothetical protein